MNSLLKDFIQDLEKTVEITSKNEIRQKIIKQFPDSPLAAESHYHLGLYYFFEEKNTDKTVAHLGWARSSQHIYWGAQARLMLATLYDLVNKKDKSLLELRFVATLEVNNELQIFEQINLFKVKLTALRLLEEKYRKDNNIKEKETIEKKRMNNLKKVLQKLQDLELESDDFHLNDDLVFYSLELIQLLKKNNVVEAKKVYGNIYSEYLTNEHLKNQYESVGKALL